MAQALRWCLASYSLDGRLTCDSIWLTDIAAGVPESVELDGLDISLNAAPPTEWLSLNVILNTWDVKQKAPGDLVGAYDIVLQTAATV